MPTSSSASPIAYPQTAVPAVVAWRLPIDGMSCAACVARVEKALRAAPGVREASVNLATEVATVWAPASADPEPWVAALQKAGYPATGLTAPLDEDAPQAEVSPAPVVASAAKPKVMGEGWQVLGAALLSAPLLAPMLLGPWAQQATLPHQWQAALAVAVQVLFGQRFYGGAAKALRAGVANMDLLVALGTTAALALSLFVWLQQGHGVAQHGLYFESSAVVITLVRLGKWLETRGRRRAAASLRALSSLRPAVAQVLRQGQWQTVPLAQLRRSDTTRVLPGERIGVDGLVVHGASHVDESMLTGESLPVARGLGHRVHAGTLNGEGALHVQATAVGGHTALARIETLVEKAQARKLPIQAWVDRISAVFVPVVLVLALLTLVGWGLVAHNWAAGWLNAVAVLVLACPCALGLATPLALMVGLGVAARQGLLVSDVQMFLKAAHLQVVAFDKTGTLTLGEPRLITAQALQAEGARPLPAVSDGWDGVVGTPWFAAALALQAASEHPLAKAMRQAAVVATPASALAATAPTAEKVSSEAASQCRVVPGRGVQGLWRGQTWFLGSSVWMQSLGAREHELKAMARLAAAQATLGRTVSWLGCGAGPNQAPKLVADQAPELEPNLNHHPALCVVGMFAFADAVRPQAREAVTQLRDLGIQSVLISGDQDGAAQAVAKQVGIETVHAQALPEQKLAIVAALKAPSGSALPQVVGMVGDGLNDAPALAAADVGMAMAGATDLAMHSAGLNLLRPDLCLVPAAVRLARRTMATVHRALFWAFAFNAVGLPLAALGHLSPMWAAAAMGLSSVCVVAQALWLGRPQKAQSDFNSLS